jgi:hypothetical protein
VQPCDIRRWKPLGSSVSVSYDVRRCRTARRTGRSRNECRNRTRSRRPSVPGAAARGLDVSVLLRLEPARAGSSSGKTRPPETGSPTAPSLQHRTERAEVAVRGARLRALPGLAAGLQLNPGGLVALPLLPQASTPVGGVPRRAGSTARGRFGTRRPRRHRSGTGRSSSSGVTASIARAPAIGSGRNRRLLLVPAISFSSRLAADFAPRRRSPSSASRRTSSSSLSPADGAGSPGHGPHRTSSSPNSSITSPVAWNCSAP